MTGKIFRAIMSVASSMLLICLAVITGVLYSQFTSLQSRQLESELALVSGGVEINGDGYLLSFNSSEFRITWVAPDGNVLFDTSADPAEMENHLDREEIAEALEKGKGASSRYSDTLTQKTMYRSVLLSDGSVLRISAGMNTIWSLLIDLIQPFVFIFIAVVILSAIIARSMAKRIVKPLNGLDLDDPMNNEAYDELSPLLGRINKQQKQITKQLEKLRAKTNEFEQIISAMREGLVLVSWQGEILSINNAAKQIFGINHDCEGEYFQTLEHELGFSNIIESALEGENSTSIMEKNGRKYQLSVTAITSDREILGAIILAFDVTDQANAEQSRREFSANVSHELKTPLQSIIGSAELLESGLVKPEDSARFIGHIRAEATRLVALVNDIIHLSQLDENSRPADETVDLYAAALEASEHLESSASKRGVTVSVNGEKTEIVGVRRYIYEIIYNLCDNAIRYNKEGGRVEISTGRSDGIAYIVVSDTGIGIPLEHQPRIFERFYRVDKSHSKDTGGTGLGLSIVKHAVQLHGGSISLSSTPGQGTIVKITF